MFLLYEYINKPLNSEILKIKENNGVLMQMKANMALNQRKIFLYDGVDEDSIFECIYYLYRIIDIDEKLGEKRPVYIMVNSNGGNVYDCLTLISLIEKMKEDGYEIITVNMGRAFSAGFMISIVGSKRLAYRYSDYMVHDVSSFSYGKLQTMREDIEETERLRDKLYSIIVRYTNITREELEEWHIKKLDKFFNSEEALSLNIVDQVI